MDYLSVNGKWIVLVCEPVPVGDSWGFILLAIIAMQEKKNATGFDNAKEDI